MDTPLGKYMAPMRDSDGKIIGATALSFTWFGQVNFSDISEDEIHAAEDGQPVSKRGFLIFNHLNSQTSLIDFWIWYCFALIAF